MSLQVLPRNHQGKEFENPAHLKSKSQVVEEDNGIEIFLASLFSGDHSDRTISVNNSGIAIIG